MDYIYGLYIRPAVVGVLRDLLRPPPGGQRTGSLCLQPGLRARRRNVSAAVVPKRSQAHRSAPLCQECVAGGALADDFGLVEEVGGQDGAGVEDLDAGELAAAPVERDEGVEAGRGLGAGRGRAG